MADQGGSGQQVKGCPRGDGCIADTAQGRGTPAAETVSKEAPAILAKNHSLPDSPSGPGNRGLQSGNFLQPCRSATSSTLPALAPGKRLQVGKAARWPLCLDGEREISRRQQNDPRFTGLWQVKGALCLGFRGRWVGSSRRSGLLLQASPGFFTAGWGRRGLQEGQERLFKSGRQECPPSPSHHCSLNFSAGIPLQMCG